MPIPRIGEDITGRQVRKHTAIEHVEGTSSRMGCLTSSMDFCIRLLTSALSITGPNGVPHDIDGPAQQVIGLLQCWHELCARLNNTICIH